MQLREGSALSPGSGGVYPQPSTAQHSPAQPAVFLLTPRVPALLQPLAQGRSFPQAGPWGHRDLGSALCPAEGFPAVPAFLRDYSPPKRVPLAEVLTFFAAGAFPVVLMLIFIAKQKVSYFPP